MTGTLILPSYYFRQTTVDNEINHPHKSIEDLFIQAAKSLNPVTDKVTSHQYQIMYGQFLLPYYQRKPQMKMLEIGLGCDMSYGVSY